MSSFQFSGFKVGPSRGRTHTWIRSARKRECLWRLRGSAMHDLRVVPHRIGGMLQSEAVASNCLQNDLSISFSGSLAKASASLRTLTAIITMCSVRLECPVLHTETQSSFAYPERLTSEGTLNDSFVPTKTLARKLQGKWVLLDRNLNRVFIVAQRSRRVLQSQSVSPHRYPDQLLRSPGAFRSQDSKRTRRGARLEKRRGHPFSLGIAGSPSMSYKMDSGSMALFIRTTPFFSPQYDTSSKMHGLSHHPPLHHQSK